MIACLGETTGTDALHRILIQMKNCKEGQQILNEKPRINTQDIDLESLGEMPEETFGFHYKQFLDSNVSVGDFFVHCTMKFNHLNYNSTSHPTQECQYVLWTIRNWLT